MESLTQIPLRSLTRGDYFKVWGNWYIFSILHTDGGYLQYCGIHPENYAIHEFSRDLVVEISPSPKNNEEIQDS
jgi:hypothetical protein